MNVIELHFNGNPRLVFIDRISAIVCDSKDTFIWLVGDTDCLYVDESYDEIKNKLFKAGFVWNV
jgi:hypothetical protein